MKEEVYKIDFNKNMPMIGKGGNGKVYSDISCKFALKKVRLTHTLN